MLENSPKADTRQEDNQESCISYLLLDNKPSPTVG